MAEFKHLFTPLRIGNVIVRNRLLVTSHSHDFYTFDHEGYTRWNMLSERAMDYHADRSKGGWGLLITGQVMVHPSCGTSRPAGYLEEVIPTYTKIAKAIHDGGARVFMQMNHNGRVRTSGTDDWHPVWAVSAGTLVYPNAGGEMCREMEVRDIKEVVAGFAKTARNMKRCGFDGVEVQSAHSYLLSEFLTPAYNKRNDQYGGSLENRMRFLREAVHAVREEVGKDYVVGVRLNAVWQLAEGLTLEDSLEVARRLEADGRIDYLNMSAWGFEMSLAGQGTPFGRLVPYAREFKKVLKRLPVFVIGRIVDPVHAEQVLAEGAADMVGMTRASIADPELPNKVREGRLEDVRVCVGAGQGCLGRHMLLKPMTCTQNPTVGREREWGIGTLRPAGQKKKVLVIGGGPAGMEAAIVAAQRGHHVTLLEKEKALGGQINLILKVQRRSEFVSVITWRKTQLEKLKVDVRLGAEATPELVASLAPEAVVVATGSVPSMESKFGAPYLWGPTLARVPGIPGADQPHVYTVWDVLRGALPGARHVVVVDGIGYHQSTDPIEYLMARGVRVTALSTAGIFAADVLYNDRSSFLEAVRGKPIAFHAMTTVREIGRDFVRVYDMQTGREFIVDGVDAVALSLGNVANDGLYRALEGTVQQLYRIGDCLTPRKIEHAHFEGQKIGREL